MAGPLQQLFQAALRRIGGTGGGAYFVTDSSFQSTKTASIAHAGAFMSNAYLAAEQAKARAFGTLPVHVYRNTENGREQVDHPLARILSKSWNPMVSAVEGWQWLTPRRDTFGEAQVRVEFRKGVPVHFWPLNCAVDKHWDAERRELRYWVEGDDFTPRGWYLSHEIYCFKTPISTDGGVTGRSLAELAANEIGLNIDLTRFYKHVIGKGFSAGGVLEAEKGVTQKQIEEIAEMNKALSGPDHAGELRIFTQGIKYKEVGQSMAEANIIDQETFILQSVARAVYVQPAKIFDYSRATFSNVEQMNIAWATDTIRPEAVAVENILNIMLADMGFPDLYVKFDLKGIMRGDFKSQMEGYRTGVYSGIYTRAEIRAWEELPFVDGTDELLHPLAYTSIDPETGEPRDITWSRSQRTPSTSNALSPLIEDARARVDARRSRDGDTDKTREFAELVFRPIRETAEALGIDIEKEISS